MDNSRWQAQFDISLQVPDRAAITGDWSRRAALYRDEARGEFAVPFGRHPRHKLDVFMPVSGGAGFLPVVFIHGGYWQMYGRSFFSHMAAGLNARGVTVVLPGYVLAPDAGVGDSTEAMRQACAMCRERFGVPLVVAGHSAGGNMAAAMLATDWAARGLPADTVSSALAISGVFDLRPLTHTTINDKLGLTVETAAAVSPLLGPAPPAGSVFDAVVGERESEEFRRQAAEIVDVWGKARIVTRYEELPGENHLTAIAPMEDAASPLVARLEALARR